MRRAQWIAVLGAAVSIFLFAGAPGAQPPAPTEPRPGGQPTPIPGPPTAPGVPPITTPPTKEKEKEKEELREPTPRPGIAVPQERVPEELFPTRAPTFGGPDLFNPPAHQGFITITPSFTLSGEYNDNVNLDSRNRKSDEIIGFFPGVTLTVQKPGFTLAAGLNTSGELHIQESSLSDFGKSVQFFGNLLYQVSPRLTFTLDDRLVYDRNTSLLTSGAVSVGLEEALRNTLTSSLRWQATPTTGVSLTGSHTLVRFQNAARSSGGEDSDTYRLLLGVDRQLTQRLSGGVSMDVAYIDVDHEKPAWTYTPAVSVAYAFTPTLTGYATAGPTIIQRESDVTLSPQPSIGVGLSKTFKFGLVTLGYDRAVTAETIGVSERQAIFGSLIASTLLRGLQLEFTPRYTIVDSNVSGNRSNTNETIKTLTLSLNATYQIARSISLIGSYTFFQQTSDRSGVGDLDQNRVFFGIQYAFPITIY
jgi:hypothetical protein